MTARTTDLLVELIRRKRDCLMTLRDMGKKQFELVTTDRITQLLDVLAARQRALLQLQQIERQLAPFRDQDPNQRRWRTPDERRECARQWAECDTLLREIVAQEKQSERELIRRRDDLAAQLQGIHLAGQARGAYTAQAQPDANRIDLTSES
jgi:hypothetical protein